MAKSKLSLTQKAKLAKDKASGKVEIKPIKKEGFFSGKKPSDAKYSRKANVLANAKKLTVTEVGNLYMGGPNMATKASAKKVDSDAYNMLSNLAKGKALKGAEAEKAIQKAFKAVARTAGAERQRTATRGAAQVKRGSEKRSNTNLLK